MLYSINYYDHKVHNSNIYYIMYKRTIYYNMKWNKM